MNFLMLLIPVFVLQNDKCVSNGINTATLEDAVNALIMQDEIIEEEDYHQAVFPIHPHENSINNNNQKQGFRQVPVLPPYPRHLTPTNASWVAVNGTEHKFFVFSAFLDSRVNYRRLIRVISATKLRKPDRVWCRYWYDLNNTKKNSSGGNRKRYVSRKARMKVIRENWNLKYSALFVNCPLLEDQPVPKEVSIVANMKSPPSNLLTVIDNYADSTSNKSDSKFVVCVKPLYDLNRVFKLIEFIELNRILGVDHFTFYNHTISPQIGCILEDYVRRGLATVLPWQLDLISQREIRTEGMFAALNDCLYRSMYVYSHVVFIDLDEFIIPRQNRTLSQLVKHLEETKSVEVETGSYSIQNAFFYQQWEDDYSIFEVEDPVATALITLRKTRRRIDLNKHNLRSKYICRPEVVVEAGNHFVWDFLPDYAYATLKVPADMAILHHYRVCEGGGNSCVKLKSTVDMSVFKYKTQLVRVVRDRFNYFKQKCNL